MGRYGVAFSLTSALSPCVKRTNVFVTGMRLVPVEVCVTSTGSLNPWQHLSRRHILRALSEPSLCPEPKCSQSSGCSVTQAGPAGRFHLPLALRRKSVYFLSGCRSAHIPYHHRASPNLTRHFSSPLVFRSTNLADLGPVHINAVSVLKIFQDRCSDTIHPHQRLLTQR